MAPVSGVMRMLVMRTDSHLVEIRDSGSLSVTVPLGSGSTGTSADRVLLGVMYVMNLETVRSVSKGSIDGPTLMAVGTFAHSDILRVEINVLLVLMIIPSTISPSTMLKMAVRSGSTVMPQSARLAGLYAYMVVR
jgi:hypothetical protein